MVSDRMIKKQRLSKPTMIAFAVFVMVALLIAVSVLNFLLWIAPVVIVAGFVYTVYMIVKKNN